jgi:carbohydrate diacid regulator
MLDDQAVGTVGITGPPNRVRRFGLVVKRQTEILLQESVLQHSRQLRERALEDLIRDLAHFDAEVLEPDFVAFRANELGYDLDLRRLAALVEVSEAVGSDDELPAPMSAAATIPQPALLRAVRERFADPQDMVAAIGAGRILTFHRIPASGSRTTVATAPRAVCERIVSDIAQRHGVQARVGIGDAANSVPELRESYEDAAAALRLGSRLDPTTRIYPIDAWRLPRVLAEVGHRTRARLIDVLAKPLQDQRDWPVLQQTVLAWCESGFNLVAAAAALHIHRNTLIYRLDKVARLTGRDTHDHRATLALYLACLADRLEL